MRNPVPLEVPEPYATVDRLIEAGDTAGATEALRAIEGDAQIIDMLRAKLALVDGSVPALAVMNRLVQLMRQNAELPGIQELDREASRLAYETGKSSLAHSHPPPPMRPKREDPK